jgi:isopentenyl-diphosphate Delta-isomerase
VSTSSKPSDGSTQGIGSRKTAHLEICTEERYHIETDDARFGDLRFLHNALPEVSADEVDTSISFLRHPIALPLFISSMTGGSETGYELNRRLAEVAERTRIPVGMGSIRILLRHPELTDHFRLKRIAPTVPVFANIGAVQLPEVEHQRIFDLLHELQVDAVAVHLNPAQELAQPEGDTDFRGVLEAFARFCKNSPVPVIAKETGFGVRPREARALMHAGARYVDVAGTGGTNWSSVESYRTSGVLKESAKELHHWGAPTALLLAVMQGTSLQGSILASGGIRSGMDLAKSLALGAVAVGMALPFARAVRAGGVDAGVTLVETIKRVVRTVMVLTSSATIAELADAPLVKNSLLTHDMQQFVHADGAAPVGGRSRT